MSGGWWMVGTVVGFRLTREVKRSEIDVICIRYSGYKFGPSMLAAVALRCCRTNVWFAGSCAFVSFFAFISQNWSVNGLPTDCTEIVLAISWNNSK